MERGDQVPREGLQRTSGLLRRGARMRKMEGRRGESAKNTCDEKSVQNSSEAGVYADRTASLCVLQSER